MSKHYRVLIHRAPVGTTTVQRGQLLEFSYKHLWIMCIRRQEGCYLPKAVPQSLKDSTCATQWSVPCPPLHHTKALHPPYQLRENRLCPICQSVLGIYVLLDFLTSFFPIHLLVHDHITSLLQTLIPHAPELMKLFIPDTPA